MAKFIIELEDTPEDLDIAEGIDYAVASAEEMDELDEMLALKSISVRLQKKLIDDLKLIARVNGIGYQPLMRIVLTRFAESELRQIARHQAAVQESKAAAEQTGKQPEMPPPYETAILKDAA